MPDELDSTQTATESGQPTIESAVPDQEAAPATDALPAGEESFLTDQQLLEKIRANPDLDHFFKKMQGSYTRKMQQASKLRDAAGLVDRFNTDPEFARLTIQQRAAQLGLTLGGATASPQAGQAAVPTQLVEAVRGQLSPELHWMAPALAASQWAGMQFALQPIQQRQEETVRSTRDQQFDQLAEHLSEKSPGWEQHEDDMDEILTFLKSDRMTDRRWGSKLELLYRLVAGTGAATAEAARRIGQAGKNRVTTGQTRAAAEPNVSDLVRKPKHMQEAWDTAAKYAVSALEKQGIKVS